MHKLFRYDDRVKETDPRKGNYVRLNLEGDSLKQIAWRKAVLQNLLINTKVIKSLKTVHVARHHWSVEQLAHFTSGPKKVKPSSPMCINDVKTLTYYVEDKCTIYNSGRKMCFNAPNYPLSQIRFDVQSVVKEQALDERFAKRLEVIENEIVNKRKRLEVVEKEKEVKRKRLEVIEKEK